jgi:hypothetical protein
VADHFAEMRNMVGIGSGRARNVVAMSPNWVSAFSNGAFAWLAWFAVDFLRPGWKFFALCASPAHASAELRLKMNLRPSDRADLEIGAPIGSETGWKRCPTSAIYFSTVVCTKWKLSCKRMSRDAA